MDLALLCLLSWLCTPGAAPPRALGRAGDLQAEARDPPGLTPGGAEGGLRRAPPVSTSDRKVALTQPPLNSPSPADDPPNWDFTLLLVVLSVAALALTIYCGFHRKCPPWLLSCLHQSGQGWTDPRGHLPGASSSSSVQRCGAFASRTPQCVPPAKTSCSTRLFPPGLHREASVHFRRATVSKDGSASFSAAAPGSGAGGGPHAETILEMEDEL